MYSPFSLRAGLKLGLVALLAEMGTQFTVPPFGGVSSHSHPRDSGIGVVAGGISQPSTVIFVVLGILLFLVLLGLFYYFGSRMQFVLMDLVAYRTTLVGPSWRKHGPQTWPWIGLKIVSFLLIFVVLGAVLALPVLHFVHSISANGSQPSGPFFGRFLLLFAALGVAALIITLFVWALRDLVLPFMVFEGATARAALSSASRLFRQEPGDVLLFFLMKLVLTIATGIAAELCILAVTFVAAIPLALIGGILWVLLHNAGPFGTACLYASLGILALIFLACLLVAGLCIVGAVLVFYQAYTLYFLGGRIPALGNLLEPPPPAVMEVAPPPFSPA